VLIDHLLVFVPPDEGGDIEARIAAINRGVHGT
jgi:hypothetical protein